LSHSPNPEILAADLERLAKTLRADGRAAVARAWDWSGHLRGSGGDTRRGSGTSDPTGSAAVNRPEASAALYAELSTALRAAQSASDALSGLLSRCAPQRTEREQENDLSALNGRSGLCEVCADHVTDPHYHSGTRDDRLKRITTGERVDGELLAPLACGPCYASWGRRPYAEGMRTLIEWEEWHNDRVKGLGK
jgi:hypothetical protein